MNIGLIATLGTIIIMLMMIAGFIGLMIYMDANRDMLPSGNLDKTSQTTKTTSSSTTLPQPTTTTMEPVLASETSVTTTSTSSTLPLKSLEVSNSQKKMYSGDSARLSVTSEGSQIAQAVVFLDGMQLFESRGTDYEIQRLDAGNHEVIVAKAGYANGSISIIVDSNTYSTSKDVKVRLTREERRMAISQGKANVRFYETAGCANCRYVLNYLNKIMDKNRDCVAYERLNLYAQDNANDVRDVFGDKSLALPFIIVDGSRGRQSGNGLVPASRIRDMIGQASGCVVE